MSKTIQSLEKMIKNSQHNIIGLTNNGEIIQAKKLNYEIKNYDKFIANQLAYIFTSVIQVTNNYKQATINNINDILKNSQNIKYFYETYINENINNIKISTYQKEYNSKDLEKKANNNFQGYLQYIYDKISKKELPNATNIKNKEIISMETSNQFFSIKIKYTNTETHNIGKELSGKDILQIINKDYIVKARGYIDIKLITKDNPLGLKFLEFSIK